VGDCSGIPEEDMCLTAGAAGSSIKCHWNNNRNSCAETKCSDLTTTDRCEVDGAAGSSIKCHWNNNSNSCAETKCSDLTSFSACRAFMVEGVSMACIWVSDYCFSFSPCGAFEDFSSCSSFLNFVSVGICMWLESEFFSGCVDRVDSCMGADHRNICLSLSGCKWSENGGCFDRKDAQEGNSTFTWWILVVIGINKCNVYLFFFFYFLISFFLSFFF
jgi:hypothetical protein